MNVAKFEIHLSGPGGAALPVGFEDAAERLTGIDRVDLEPDGHFLWMIDAQEGRQLAGMLYDDGDRLQYVHLQGRCGWEDFQRFLDHLAPGHRDYRVTQLPEGRLQGLHTFRTAMWPEVSQGPATEKF